jgi:uncharacterized OsmC-like protein
MANVTFKANVKWSGDKTYCEGTSREFMVPIDEPQDLGGDNRAMNPVELLLNSLGGCMAICAAAFAGKFKVDLKGFYVELEGDLDPDGFLGKNPDVRPGYQTIRYKMHFDTPSPQENIDKLKAYIKEKCPVSDTLCGVKVEES